MFNPDESIKLKDMLCFNLYAASRAMTDAYRPVLEVLGLTYPQYLVMVILWEHETCSVKDLGALLSLDSGTLSPLLKRLEAARFIKRQRSLTDERIVNITLAEEGRALERRAASVPVHVACQHGLSPEAYNTLLSELEVLRATLEASARASSTSPSAS